MGLLMTIGFFGMLGYMGYFAKQETKAIIGDSTIKPTYSLDADKSLIDKHFKLICKRCDVKLDKDENPIDKNRYKPCIAYLLYQGFQEPATEYFKEIYLQKYDSKEKKKKEDIEEKHLKLYSQITLLGNKKTKLLRKWHYGSKKSVQEKCFNMTDNLLWTNLTHNRYNIVRDGDQYVVVWTVKAPPEILKQIDKIYDEVCYIQGI